MRARRSNLHSWMMQCVVVCCSMLQVMRCIAVQIKHTHIYAGTTLESAQLDDAVCCSVLQYVAGDAVYCSTN